MIAGIVLFALGVKKVLEHTGDPLKDMPAVALCGGLALYLLAHVAFRLRNTGSVGWRRIVAAAVCLAVIPVALEVSGVATLAILLGVVDRADRLRGDARRRGPRADSCRADRSLEDHGQDVRARNPTICLTAAAVALVDSRRGAGARLHEAVPRMTVAGGPPMAFGGPTGRRALDGRWTLRLGGRRAERARAVLARTPAACRRWPATAGRSPAIGRASRSREAGDYAIRFESVNHRARVWLDGRLVARHTGAYLPFEARRRLTRRSPHARRARGLARIRSG